MLNDFYRQKPWMDLMKLLKLERLNDCGELICEHCGKPIVKSYDCIGHHTVELTEQNVNDAGISLNPSLVMLVHHRCHNEIHKRFGFEDAKQVYLVWGSPCSGKSRFVRDNAGADDIVCDIDKIWQMVSINEEYVKPPRLAGNVFGIRDCLLDMVRTRKGKWRNAYVVGGYPLAGERERLVNRLGAREIYIDTPKDVCLERALGKPDGWTEFVLDWWRKYTPPTSG